MDIRTRYLAKLVTGKHALNIKKDESVIISGSIEASEFIVALYKEIILLGAHPTIRASFPGTSPFFYKFAKQYQIEKFPDFFDYMVKNSQKYIGIDTESNTRELSGCNPKKIAARSKVTHPISEYICNSRPKMCRTTVAFPCPALAQEAEMDLTEYENFVYQACLFNYNSLSQLMNKVLKTFKKGKSVHLLGKGVDLKFRIHGNLAKSDIDMENIPMGEVFMAPVRESLNGWIKFDYPAIRNGNEVTDISLEFKDGKVIKATASKNEEFLKTMLQIDENASFVGEFGIGLNPKITKYTKNLLFDEKISGTIHLALGAAYKDNGGGNDSALHWDIVKDMKHAKIILDGKVVQENGKWVI